MDVMEEEEALGPAAAVGAGADSDGRSPSLLRWTVTGTTFLAASLTCVGVGP